MEYTGGNQLFEKSFYENVEEQIRFKIGLELRDEYETDQKLAKKNLAELNNILISGDLIQLKKFFVNKPAAEWLNIVFIDESELDQLISKIKMASSECRSVISTAIKKELSRLINFKTLFEHILGNS